MLQQILWTACVTPFKKDVDHIDYISLEKILRQQEKAGNGILLFGSTGEGMALSELEKREILEFVCKLGLKTEIAVGVSGYNFSACLEFIDFCNSLPIDGYLMTTPIYAKPGIKSQTMWFENLLDKANKPSMLYNIPSRAGVKLHADTVKNLAMHPNFVAIKDSGGTINSIIEYRNAAENIKIFCGDDAMMPAAGAEGAIGLISVCANAWPEKTREYVKSLLDGKRIDTTPWWQMSDVIFSVTNPIPIKKLLEEFGDIACGELRLPLSMTELSGKKLTDLLPASFRK